MMMNDARLQPHSVCFCCLQSLCVCVCVILVMGGLGDCPGCWQMFAGWSVLESVSPESRSQKWVTQWDGGWSADYLLTRTTTTTTTQHNAHHRRMGGEVGGLLCSALSRPADGSLISVNVALLPPAGHYSGCGTRRIAVINAWHCCWCSCLSVCPGVQQRTQ